MATLNVKNMPDPLYRRLRARAKRERRSVAQEVIRILDDALSEPKSLSILELGPPAGRCSARRSTRGCPRGDGTAALGPAKSVRSRWTRGRP